MTLKWYQIKPNKEATFLHEGEDVHDSPRLDAMQAAVGGLIERIPNAYLHDGAGKPYHTVLFEADEMAVRGTLVEVWCNEESKLEFYSLTERVHAERHVEENINPLSFIMQPHDFILGNVVVVLSDVEEEPSRTQTPSDEQED